MPRGDGTGPGGMGPGTGRGLGGCPVKGPVQAREPGASKGGTAGFLQMIIDLGFSLSRALGGGGKGSGSGAGRGGRSGRSGF
jgi:hypothetical protein